MSRHYTTLSAVTHPVDPIDRSKSEDLKKRLEKDRRHLDRLDPEQAGIHILACLAETDTRFRFPPPASPRFT